MWTLVALVALVFYYSKGLYRVYLISIRGNDEFVKSVKRALGLSHLRYKLADNAAAIVFDGKKRVFSINGYTYHLDWPEEVKKEAMDGTNCDGNCELFPVFNGKVDKSELGVLLGCVDIIKGKGSRIFKDGWLAVKIAVFKNGKLILVYDPLKKEKAWLSY